MTDWDQTYKNLKKFNWIILLLLSSISYFLMKSSFTLGVILGGLIIIANFSLLQSTIRNAFPGDGLVKTRKSVLILKSFFRLFFLGGVIYLLITRGLIDPIGLTIGISTVVFSIVGFGINRAWKLRIEGIV